jgi:vanillate O-demethylase ferredoxin subunit
MSVDSILRDPARGSHVYVCGPTGFIDYATAAAQRHGWHSNQIHLEYFGAELVTHGAPFTVICARSGISVVVGPDDTIAGALTAAGIEVNMACQEGICGTCVTPVLAGIPDHRDLFLDLEVKAENSCLMLCCSRAKTPTITLDI